MKFKYYFRKSSFKKDIASANILLEQIEIYKPQNFLEVGVFQGVTSRNICEKLNLIHQGSMKDILHILNYYLLIVLATLLQDP